MIELDPGHLFDLDVLDGDEWKHLRLQFVKRTGEKYPGNTSAYPGVTSQEVMRALIKRALYVESQESHSANREVVTMLRGAIYVLEFRAAARRDDRDHFLKMWVQCEQYAEDIPTCPSCGHVFCREKHV